MNNIPLQGSQYSSVKAELRDEFNNDIKFAIREELKPELKNEIKEELNFYPHVCIAIFCEAKYDCIT